MKPDQEFAFDNPAWYRRLLLRLRYGAGLQNYPAFAEIVAGFLRDELGLPEPAADGEAAVAADAAQLATDGFCRLGRVLTPEQVAEAVAHLEQHPVHDSFERIPGRFPRASVPPSVHTGAHRVSEALAACPHLLDVANAPPILARMHRFLGAPPTIQFFSSWWSFAGRETPEDAQLFHYDRHCFRFAKLFVYLTDVDEDAGPHVYVRGSARAADWMQRLAEIKARDPAQAQRFLGMLIAARKDDADVADFFGADRLERFTGRAGEAFLVDTAGIHKGLLPRSRDRLVFQTTYALLPDFKATVDKIEHPGFFTDLGGRAGGGLDPSYAAYVSRMVIADN